MIQIGTASAFSLGTPSITLSDIVSAEWQVDPEILEHFSSNHHYPSISLGNLNCQLTVVTTDSSVVSKLVKGMEVKTASITYNPVVSDISAEDFSLTKAAGSIVYTISNGRIVEPIVVTAASEKSPAEYSIVIKASRDKSSGGAPTITSTVTLSSGGSGGSGGGSEE